MSYCGTCGSFFTPDCPHGRGSCAPAVNPFEAKIAILKAETLVTSLLAESFNAPTPRVAEILHNLAQKLAAKTEQMRKEANV